MKQPYLEEQWIKLSSSWIKEAREGRNPTRSGLLDPPMLEACGNVEGLRVLDSGCREGRFCRLLAQRGAAFVLGVDLCEPMIDAANALHANRVEYRIADVQDLRFIGDESFDLAVSYLNQCDLPDFRANNKEIFRVLTSGSRLIVANLHPMRSAVGYWQKTPDGKKEHVILDNYLNEGERHWLMKEVEITNFHRSLATCVNGFIADGFMIEGLVEPTVTEDQLKSFPELDDELRVPNFIIYRLRKP